MFQRIARTYRLTRILEAERVELERSTEREVESETLAERERLETESLAERKRIAGEQQKAYDKRSKRAVKVRRVEAYSKE